MFSKKGLLSIAVVTLIVVGSVVRSGDLLQGRLSVKNMKDFAKPDLAVTEIYVDEDYKLTIDVENHGRSDVKNTNGHTYVYIDNRLEWTYSWSTLADQDFLNAGGSSTLQPQTLEEIETVVVCVDANEVVPEREEANNCLTKQVGPNLYLSYLSTDPSPAKVGEPLTVYFNVQNQGSMPVPASEVTLTYRINEEDYVTETYSFDETPAPGASSDIAIEIANVPEGRSYTAGNKTSTHFLGITDVVFSEDHLGSPIGTTAIYFDAE